MGRALVVCIICCLVSAVSRCAAQSAPRSGPWTKEQAWEWYKAQPWIRGCNYMPASCANRVNQWQELGSKERFEEMERELEDLEQELSVLVLSAEMHK